MVPWTLDSGAYTELDRTGGWSLTAGTWAGLVRRWSDEAGSLVAAAVQDWLCHPAALERTGLTVEEHQARTVRSVLDLLDLAPDLPWLPTLQGWRVDDYLRHRDQYAAAGVDLAGFGLVGVGSIASRQDSANVAWLFERLHRDGLGNLHAFGAKTSGLERWGYAVASADSMAWSFVARRENVKVCEAKHARCTNCLVWAEQWYRQVAHLVGRPVQQLALPVD